MPDKSCKTAKEVKDYVLKLVTEYTKHYIDNSGETDIGAYGFALNEFNSLAQDIDLIKLE